MRRKEGREGRKGRKRGKRKRVRKFLGNRIFFPFILPMRNLMKNTLPLLTQNRLQASFGFVEGDFKKKFIFTAGM